MNFAQRNKDSDKPRATCWMQNVGGDLPHFKDSLKALLNDAELQCLNEINYLSTKHHPKIAFVFACNISKEQHMLYLVTCLLARSTRTMPLLILYEQLVCFSDDGSCCNMSVFFEQIRASWNRSLVDALTCNPQGRRQERFAQGLPFCLFLLIVLHLNEKFRIREVLDGTDVPLNLGILGEISIFRSVVQIWMT